MAKTKKPMDAGFKRNMMILGGVVGVAVLVVGGIAYTSANSSKSLPAAQANVGRIMPAPSGQVTELTPAQREKLERVQSSEAEAARRAGRSYMPDAMLGTPKAVESAKKEDAPPPRAEQTGSYAQFKQNQNRTVKNEGADSQKVVSDGVMRQAQAIIATLSTVATEQVVEIADLTQMVSTSSAGARATLAVAKADAAPKEQLVGADEILAGRVLTPVDTYKSKFVLAEIAGGPLDGAQLRGEVVPMNQSGDVEDVGIRFTSMRLNGHAYPIDAMALNESSATDAMDGDVDHRVFARYVLPVMMAGLSGASTYFTARGTPSTSIAANVSGGEAVVVNQERASQEDAKNQGIGDAIDKGVQLGERTINRDANRPNRITLDAGQAIGVIFNKPVLVP